MLLKSVWGSETYCIVATELHPGTGDGQSQQLPSDTAGAEDIHHSLGFLPLHALHLGLHVIQLKLQIIFLPQPVQG